MMFKMISATVLEKRMEYGERRFEKVMIYG